MIHTEGRVATGMSDFPNKYNIFINSMEEDINPTGLFITDSKDLFMVAENRETLFSKIK